MKKLLSFAALALLIVGCTATPVQPPAEKWQTLDTGAYSLEAPQNWYYEDQQGIDSKVGIFAVKGEKDRKARFISDLGEYSNQLSQYDKTDMVSYETLDGKKAKIVVDRKDQLVAMYIASAKTIDLSGGRRLEFDLCIASDHLKNEEEVQLALKILRTIKFKK